MPDWGVHRFWARRLGIGDGVSSRVDEMIDLGCELDFKSGRVRLSHDWVKGGVGVFLIALEYFYRRFGVDGVKAMILHGALDYMEQVRRLFAKDEVLWRTILWIKYCGGRHRIRYIRYAIPESERVPYVLHQGYEYFRDAIRSAGLPEEVLDAVRELVSFIVENFEEILESIKPHGENKKR